MSNYLTGEATYKDGRLIEVAIFCTDEPDDEMQRHGILHETYVETAERVIEYLKSGSTLVASFRKGGDIPVEIITVNGVETLEVVQQGQNADHCSLRKLPPVATSEKHVWCQQFFDAFKQLSSTDSDLVAISDLAYYSYEEHGKKEPAAAALEMYAARYTAD